jgi:6-phosphogluconolactonase
VIRPAIALHVEPSAAALFDAVAERFVTLASERPSAATIAPFTVALAGGNTPRALYERLASAAFRPRIDWSRVVFAFGDERCVPPSDPASNERMARAALLDHVPASVLRVPTELAPPEAARAYERTLRALFRAPEGLPPRTFDLVLLGLGADGHTASLFPGAPSLAEERAWALAAAPPMPGPERITLTLPVLAAARELLVLVSGGDKHAALAATLDGPHAPARYPLQALAARAAQLSVWADAAAAGALRNR